MNLLSGHNINFDSKITLVIMTSTNGFEFHRVFSSEHKRGFPLRITNIGNFSDDRVHLNRMKNERVNLEKNVASVCICVRIFSNLKVSFTI